MTNASVSAMATARASML